jgi:hypothetical protein
MPGGVGGDPSVTLAAPIPIGTLVLRKFPFKNKELQTYSKSRVRFRAPIAFLCVLT